MEDLSKRRHRDFLREVSETWQGGGGKMEQLTLFRDEFDFFFSPRLVLMGCHDGSRRSRETNCEYVKSFGQRAPRGEVRKENEDWQGRGRFGTPLKIGRSFLDNEKCLPSWLGHFSSSYFAFPGGFRPIVWYCVICSHLVHPFLFRPLSEYVFTNTCLFFLFSFRVEFDFCSDFFSSGYPDVVFFFFLIKLRSSWLSWFSIKCWIVINFRNERCVIDF